MNPIVEQIIGKLIIDPTFRQAFKADRAEGVGALPADANRARRSDALRRAGDRSGRA